MKKVCPINGKLFCLPGELGETNEKYIVNWRFHKIRGGE